MKRILLLTSILILFLGIITPTIFAISINSTSAEGTVAYNELNVQTPRYRTWNFSTNNFSVEKTDTNSLASLTQESSKQKFSKKKRRGNVSRSKR